MGELRTGEVFANEPAEQLNAQEVRKAAFRNKYRGHTLNAMIRSMQMLRDKKEEVEQQLKGINDEFDVLRIELIPQTMEDGGIASPYNVEGVGRVTLTGDMWVRTINADALKGWLRKSKFGSLIVESINPSTLKAFIKGRIEDGKPLPPEDAVRYEAFTRASITAVKK
jgi:hypothetical protein